MSAERLRQAADRLDALADEAPGGPWSSWIEGRDGNGGDSVVLTGSDDLYVHVYDNIKASDAAQDYIAAVHPGVGKALAKVLRGVAADFTDEQDYSGGDYVSDALAVADAILGGAA